jgi:hypothetical protein
MHKIVPLRAAPKCPGVQSEVSTIERASVLLPVRYGARSLAPVNPRLFT